MSDRDETVDTHSLAARILVGLSLMSGMGSVVYEVIYMRQLSAVLGDMYYVHATLVCIFLFGLGLGALLARRAIRWLPLFEGFIGAWALGFPWLLDAYQASALATIVSDPVAYSVVSVILLLTPPAVAIGFSVPLFSRYIAEISEDDQPFGLAYYAYNFGACLSILVVEFWLLRLLPHTWALAIVACLNLTCALVLWLGRSVWTPTERVATADTDLSGREAMALGLVSVGSALFHSFFIMVAYHLMMPHRENFALCTAAVLLGIALGSDVSRRGISFGRAALYGAISVAVVGLLAPGWGILYDAHTGLTGWSDLVHRFVILALLGGGPYIFLGATIPALVRGRDAAATSGVCLFISGVGNVVGFLGYVFVIHPHTHVFTPILLAVAALAGAVWLVSMSRRAKLGVVFAVVAAACTLLYPQRFVYLIYDRGAAQWDLEYIKDASDTVVVATHDDGRVKLSYNGHPSIHARAEGGDYNPSEQLSGLLSAPFAPSTERAMVLGMGTGMTAGSAAQIYDHVDVVEINRAFWEVSHLLEEGNFHLLENPAATIHHEDGRRYLMHAETSYDAIINSVPSPRFAAAAKLYTVEYFEQVAQRLKPGGVYATWFTIGDMSPKGIDTLLASLHSVFAHCQLSMLKKHYLFLTCSEQPLTRRPLKTLDLPPEYVASMRKRLAPEEGLSLGAYLRAVDMSRDIFAQAPPQAATNRDDYPLLEYQIMDFYRGGYVLDGMLTTMLDRADEWAIAPRVHPTHDDVAASQARVIRRLYPELFEEFIAPELDRRSIKLPPLKESP